MAYDENLAARIRKVLSSEEGITEKKMFGGLAFLLYGNMTIAASSKGGLLVRVDPAKSDELLATTPAEPMEMHGRSMHGWLRCSPEHLSDTDLERWIGLSLDYVHNLPPKN